MGLIISRFRRKKTTIQILEEIDKEINHLQRNRKENQDRQKQVATGLIIYSIILYILASIVFFLLYFPDTWPLRLLYSLPLLAFPFLIWGIKKLLHWYFVKRIAGNDLALRDLREKKKQILEDVMETETYKKAKEILEKFDPARFKKLEKDEQSTSLSPTSTPTTGTVLQQRKPTVSQPTSQPSTPRAPSTVPTLRIRPPSSSTQPTPNPFINTPLRAPPPSSVTPAMSAGRGISQQQIVRVQSMPQQSMPPQMGRGYGPPGPPMPRSVLPRDRGVMDKVMDYLVGDGPENRFALICRACHSHNGMALKEEFEYLSFRCCYCFVMNPARKQRPLAPKLEFFTPTPKVITLTKPEESDDDDDEEEDSNDDDDGINKDNRDEKEIIKSPSSSSATSTPVSSKNKSKLPVTVTVTTSTGSKPVPSGPQSPTTTTTTQRSSGVSSQHPTGVTNKTTTQTVPTKLDARREEVGVNQHQIAEESSANSSLSSSTTTATHREEGVSLGEGERVKDSVDNEGYVVGGECDDEYEMISADGEVGDAISNVKTSGDIGKDEDASGAARSS